MTQSNACGGEVARATELHLLCDVLQQLVSQPPGMEPRWETLVLAQILRDVLPPAGWQQLVEYFSLKLGQNWRGVLQADSARLIGPFPRVCNQEEPHHS